MVLGIGTLDDEQQLFTFAQQMQLTFPTLFDIDDQVYNLYAQVTRFGASTFPQDVLIGADGIIVFQAVSYDPGTMIYAIEAALDAAE